MALQNARRAGDSYAASRLEKALQPMGMAQAPNLREYVPTPSNVPQPQIDPRLSPLDQAEQLSMGLGTGVVNQLEGAKQLVTDPIGSAKALYEGGREIVRNPALLGEMAQDIYGRATSGPMGFGEVVGEFVNPLRVRAPVMREIDVYHGSPHRFEEFDASKIGTGEGAQAYGHGIYFAENPDVAMSYKNRLEAGSGNRDIDVMARVLQSTNNDPIAAAAELRSRAKTSTIPERTSAFLEMADKLEKGFNPFGAFYKADLPDEMVDRMLDWDKPLNEQSPKVRQAIKEAGLTQYVDEMEKSYLSSLPPKAQALALKMINGPDKMVIVQGKGFRGNKVAARNWAQLERLAPEIDHNQINDIRDWYQSKSGADLYAEMAGRRKIGNGVWIMSQGVRAGYSKNRPFVNFGLSQLLTGRNEQGVTSAAVASERLRQMGIPGIKYADAGSRGQGGSGTRNFVVFPGEEKKVKVKERD
ncbi:MAG: hypothetical protein ACO3UV_13240 [Pseudomonadales bacterium]